jgi:hypothetical protein
LENAHNNEVNGEKMQRRPLVWKYCIAAAAVGLGIFYIYTVFAARSLHIALSPLTEEERRKFGALAKTLETAEHYPHREVDNTSVGFGDIEHRLQVVGQLVDAFQFTFRRLPASIDELIDLLPAGRYGQAQAKKEIRLESRDCRIFNLSAESYFLNCDGWSPNEKALQDVQAAADKQYVRFYNFNGHVVLSVPPPYVVRP